MRNTDLISTLAAANPLPANEVAALEDSPARETIRASIDRRRSHDPAPRPADNRSRRPFIIGGAVAVALAVPALAFSGVLDSLFGFSNSGRSVSTQQLELNDAQILEQDHVDIGAGVKLLATRDGTAFYASRTSDGRTCFLNGPASGTAPTRILISTPCESDFPSVEHPLLGQYVLVRKPPNRLQSVGGLEGLAADGVATVEAVDTNGDVILKAPVSGNVYFAHLDLQRTEITAAAAKIVALNASGDVVYTEAIPQPAKG
jgi:hypothetical protein